MYLGSQINGGGGLSGIYTTTRKTRKSYIVAVSLATTARKRPQVCIFTASATSNKRSIITPHKSRPDHILSQNQPVLVKQTARKRNTSKWNRECNPQTTLSATSTKGVPQASLFSSYFFRRTSLANITTSPELTMSPGLNDPAY